MLGDTEMRSVKKGDIIQISRRGYFICDEPFVASGTAESGVLVGSPLVLFNIPEGNKRESPTSYMSLTNQKYKSVEMAEEAELKAKTEPKDAKQQQQQKAASPAPAAAKASFDLAQAEQLSAQIKTRGETVRDLKTQKAAKVPILKFISRNQIWNENYLFNKLGKSWRWSEGVAGSEGAVQEADIDRLEAGFGAGQACRRGSQSRKLTVLLVVFVLASHVDLKKLFTSH